MTSFIQPSFPTQHPGVVRIESALATVRAMRQGFDSTRGLSVMLLAAMVSALVAQILKYSLVFVVFVLVFTLAAVLWFSARLVRPVEKLTAATGKIAAGQWKLGLEVERDDEIGRLVEAFNHMGGELDRKSVV